MIKNLDTIYLLPGSLLRKMLPRSKKITKIVFFSSVVSLIVFPSIVSLSSFVTLNSSTAKQSEPTEPRFLSNQILIKVKQEAKGRVKEGNPKDTGIDSLNKILDKYQAKNFERVVKPVKNSKVDHDLFFWYVITLDGDPEKIQGHLDKKSGLLKSSNAKISRLQELISALRSDSDIKEVELNYVITTQVVPNDPYYSSTGSWGQSYDDLWGMKKINASGAWDQVTGSSSMIVADIDTGVDRNHEDIKDNMWVNAGEIPGNGKDDDSNGYTDDYYGWNFVSNTADPMDDYGHGTHTVGTIAAKGNNGIGVVGVNWILQIMALKFLDSAGSGTLENAIRALQYAADMGAKVSSNSWGCECNSQAMDDAVKYEHDKGMVVVVAAGNSGADALDFSPASADNAIAVAASDPNDVKASFSNGGEKIDVAAPGVDILSARAGINPMCTAARTVGTNYCRVSGTSMATPHVAGLAVLLLAKNPTLTNEEIRQLIRGSATDLGAAGKDSDFGYGRIDANVALASASAKPLSPIITSPLSRTKVGGQVQFFGSVPGPNFASYKIEGGAGRLPTSWTTLAQSSTQVVNGVLATVDTTKLSEGPNIFRLTAIATDDGKSYQFQIHDVEVDNVDAEIIMPALLVPKGTVDIYGTARTKNGLGFNSYNLEWQQQGGSLKWWAIGITRENNGQNPVVDSKLGTIDTVAAGFVDGQIYNLRLTVVDSNYSSHYYIVSVTLDKDLVAGWSKPIEAKYDLGYYDFVTPALEDLDGDGVKEVIVLEPAGKIKVFRKDGSSFPGFPVSADSGYYFNFPVNVVDLDGDGKKEIIAAAVSESSQAKIYIISNNGTTYPGWPTPQFYSRYNYNDITPVVSDLNLDGKKDLIFADSYGNIHALNTNGNELLGFPKKVLLDNHYGPSFSVADINKDGKPEIMAVSSNFNSLENRVFVLDQNGNILSGWPYTGTVLPGYASPTVFKTTPAVGDINGDGNLEIFAVGQISVASQPSPDAAVYGWREDGSLLPGWPQLGGRVLPANNQPVLSSPSVADVDGDGKDEVVVATYGVRVYGLAGLKYKEVSDNGITSPAISDVDGDGKYELSSIYNYHPRIVDDNGSTYWERNFPYSSEPWNVYKFLSPAVIADLDNNGQVELVLVHSLARETSKTNTYIYVWELPNTNPAQYPWPMFGHDPARTGNLNIKPTPSPTSTPSPTPSPTPTSVPDTTPPTVSVTSPLNGSTVVRNTAINITASASDASGVAKVEFYVNDVLKCTDNSSPYVCTWKIPAKPRVTYTLKVTAYDKAGNSASFSIQVTSS